MFISSLSLLKDKGAHRLISRKSQFDIKIGFIIIKGQGGTQAYKQKKSNSISILGLALLKDKGAHRLISRKVQFDIKTGFIISKGQGGTQAYKQKKSNSI